MIALHRLIVLAVLPLLILTARAPVLAQGQVEAAAAAQRQETDLTGTWANRLHEDWVERAPGPHIGDYTGLPINDEARAIADAYQVSMQNMPERQCILYTTQYIPSTSSWVRRTCASTPSATPSRAPWWRGA
jgi:hypothetical protein